MRVRWLRSTMEAQNDLEVISPTTRHESSKTFARGTELGPTNGPWQITEPEPDSMIAQRGADLAIASSRTDPGRFPAPTLPSQGGIHPFIGNWRSSLPLYTGSGREGRHRPLTTRGDVRSGMAEEGKPGPSKEGSGSGILDAVGPRGIYGIEVVRRARRRAWVCDGDCWAARGSAGEG